MLLTYFEPLRTIDSREQLEVLNMFRRAWHGFSCQGVVSYEKYPAQFHPRFNELSELLKTYPEVTPAGYREQCFFRWLAFSQVASNKEPLLILDYDVFPVGTPVDLQWFQARFDKPTLLNDVNPCAVFLPDGSFLNAIVEMLFLPVVPDVEACGLHVGDNTVFAQHWKTIGGEFASVVSYPPDVQPPLVHFANSYVVGNKADFIRGHLI